MCRKHLSYSPAAIAYMSDFFYVCQVRLVALTVGGNFPRLMKFGHFHAPKSWSLLHLLTWFFFIFLRIEWWTTLTMDIFFYKNLGKIQPIWKIVEKCYFWTLGRILSPCRCNWKNTKPMVKVVHHSILDKIKKNQVNRCSRLQDLGAWLSNIFQTIYTNIYKDTYARSLKMFSVIFTDFSNRNMTVLLTDIICLPYTEKNGYWPIISRYWGTMLIAFNYVTNI